MKQINSDQIITNVIPDNTLKAIPRDMADAKSVSSKSGLGLSNSATQPVISDAPSVPETLANQKIIPETPSLIGVKSQAVKIKDDGTYSIDIVIEVEDIPNVSDYEVRISKSAGSI